MQWLLVLYENWDAVGQPDGIGTWSSAIVAMGLATPDEKTWLMRTHAIVSAARKYSVTPTCLDTTMTMSELPADGLSLAAASWEFEGRILLQALERTNGNKNRAAKLLRLNRTTFVEKVRMHVRHGDRTLAPYFAGDVSELQACALAGVRDAI